MGNASCKVHFRQWTRFVPDNNTKWWTYNGCSDNCGQRRWSLSLNFWLYIVIRLQQNGCCYWLAMLCAINVLQLHCSIQCLTNRKIRKLIFLYLQTISTSRKSMFVVINHSIYFDIWDMILLSFNLCLTVCYISENIRDDNGHWLSCWYDIIS